MPTCSSTEPGSSSALALPTGFEATAIQSSGDFVWVDGTLRGRRAVLVVGAGELGPVVKRTIRLARTDDANLVFRAPDELVLTSNGSLFRVRIPA